MSFIPVLILLNITIISSIAITRTVYNPTQFKIYSLGITCNKEIIIQDKYPIHSTGFDFPSVFIAWKNSYIEISATTVNTPSTI